MHCCHTTAELALHVSLLLSGCCHVLTKASASCIVKLCSVVPNHATNCFEQTRMLICTRNDSRCSFISEASLHGASLRVSCNSNVPSWTALPHFCPCAEAYVGITVALTV
jgi:hypothetical protein